MPIAVDLVISLVQSAVSFARWIVQPGFYQNLLIICFCIGTILLCINNLYPTNTLIPWLLDEKELVTAHFMIYFSLKAWYNEICEWYQKRHEPKAGEGEAEAKEREASAKKREVLRAKTTATEAAWIQFRRTGQVRGYYTRLPLDVKWMEDHGYNGVVGITGEFDLRELDFYDLKAKNKENVLDIKMYGLVREKTRAQ
jgi:hypothetical protein